MCIKLICCSWLMLYTVYVMISGKEILLYKIEEKKSPIISQTQHMVTPIPISISTKEKEWEHKKKGSYTGS